MSLSLPRSLRAAAVLLSALLVNFSPSAAAKNGNPSSPPPAPAGPPAPTLAAPANGTSLVQPVTLDWNEVSASGGAIGSYLWQVGTTSAFTTVVASGFTNNLSDSFPTPTQDKISGLPNATYFWRVKATQLTTSGGVDSAWSAIRSFTVTGLGAAPGTPTIITPTSPARFHVSEFFDVKWAAVPGAQYYLLEADDEPTFSHPLSLTTSALTFGTQSVEGWGNAIPNIYYRVRAVSADNVRSLPSATLAVQITNAAPVPPAPTPLSPTAGNTVTLPFTFDWSDTPNARFPSYDLDVDTNPNFPGSFGVLLVPGNIRSDYMVTSDLLPPGNYFWRVRAVHGQQPGPWSAGRAITVAAPPSQPPLGLMDVIADPPTAYGGNPARARVRLNMPAPAGGALINLAGDLPEVNMPATVTIPAGKTDATIFPIPTTPLPGAGGVGTIRAADTHEWQLGSLGLGPILYGTGLSAESVVGGNSATGTVTLNSPAPASGATVRLVSSDTGVVRVPATVFIPAGGTDAAFVVSTSAVSAATRVVIESGTESDGFRAPQSSIVVRPAGTPAPAPSLSALSLTPTSILAGGTATGTVTLTSPAPAGGAVVFVSGSTDGSSLLPPGGVTVPAGSLSANFTLTAPQVWTTQWPLIQARDGSSGGTQAKILQIDPNPAGPPTLQAMGPSSLDVVGGNSVRASVALIMVAPPGGAAVSLTSDNPSVVQVPATVSIAAGNSTNSFTCTTSAVSILTTVSVEATAGGVTRTIFVNVAPDPNAPPLLQSVAVNPTSVSGGTNATGTVFLSAAAPAGGIFVTLATSNSSVAQVPPIVSVSGGQLFANFTVTTSTVSANTTATLTAFFGSTSRSAALSVTRGGGTTPPTGLPAPSLSSPAADARFSPGQSITFDWSNVTGAASYTIQIDNSSSFTVPLTVDQTVTASQYSSSSLSKQTYWFRARANDASGNTGTWSAARRFEVK